MDESVKKPILSIYGFTNTNFFKLCCPKLVSFPAQTPGRITGISPTKTLGGEEGGLLAIT